MKDTHTRMDHANIGLKAIDKAIDNLSEVICALMLAGLENSALTVQDLYTQLQEERTYTEVAINHWKTT